jgi:hypothetical protein
MRWFVFLLPFAVIALPAGAAKRESVAGLEQTLNAASAAHKPDGEIVRMIAGVELSERLTDATLDRLKTQLHADVQVGQALQLLADQSAFLDPPASELPVTPAPDDTIQKLMLEAARIYGSQVLPRLPNFLATRTTHRYNDTPQATGRGGGQVRVGMHLVDTSSQETSVNNERYLQSRESGSGSLSAQRGQISTGEFGSTLGMILADTMNGKISWSHWEQSPSGQVAVFHYSVPRSASHYEVIGTFQSFDTSLPSGAQSLGGPRMSGRGASVEATTMNEAQRQNSVPAGASIIRATPGYHGSLWVDPATGYILRITMEAELKPGDPVLRAAMLVQYGAVEIGGSSFICPVRSLALSMAVNDERENSLNEPTELLNETLFTGYHHFAASTRIITDAATPGPEAPASGEVKPQ